VSKRIVAGILLGLAGMAFVQAQTSVRSPEDEAAIRKSADGYAAAFNKGDIDSIMAHWAADADFMDEAGKLHRGKDAIAALFKKGITNLKGHKLALKVVNLRLIRPDVALEDGMTVLSAPDGSSTAGRYAAVWTKTGGKWLLSSVRDLPNEAVADAGNQARLKELEWLVGDWQPEDKAGVVTVSCKWVLNKNYLQLDFTVKTKDGESLTVQQMVGYDATAGQIKSWFFDSHGGHGEAYWTRKGNKWTMQNVGVLADGRTGSATNTIQFVDEKTFTFHSQDREIDGQPIGDSDVKFIRK